ncbi:ankyrin repeat domain-containing protein SOWAHC isoform X2 [Exaiptasia diaphana]|uniref:SOWAHA-C winged helix-turn-helix domain-containing protein n=1 Tax=Exaiptasia diaphana TaxID=2652724 RepID=A0A913WRI0_EXADI|nr:ankyrin repeat domain-containing protein SOWAHC isoform X2 [Exaiptasia diaphana]
MSGNEPLTFATVREYMLKNDGKVKNHDLVTHFRQQLNDPANKNKVRGDFKDIVHQLATVQEINGEKYFVLKKPREAPAVLRKPASSKPPRSHPSSHKSRPVSGPPVMRNAKLFEDMLSSQMTKGHAPGSVGHASEFDKENRSDVKSLVKEHMRKAASVDSIDSTGSSNNTPKQSRKVSSSGARGGETEDKISLISGDDMLDDAEFEGEEFTGPAIQLEPLEKEWLLTAARGNRANIMCLLEQEPSLAKKRDFTSGYTALHWAAKHGREDIVSMLAKKGIDVNTKSHGGYTPLHLASMQGHDKVIKVLVEEFDANICSRDNSGRKPRQVASSSLTIEAQRLLEHILSDSASSDNRTSVSKKKQSSAKQYGSINSIITPSAALVGFYGDKQLQPPDHGASDKPRDRASSFGKFLKKDKKKHKKDQRASTADFPSEYATPSAGPSPNLHRPCQKGTGAEFETNVIRSSFRRLVGTTMDKRTARKRLLIGSPQQLQQVEDERRENELELHRTHSDPSFKKTTEI